jgi:hypothetical protein
MIRVYGIISEIVLFLKVLKPFKISCIDSGFAYSCYNACTLVVFVVIFYNCLKFWIHSFSGTGPASLCVSNSCLFWITVGTVAIKCNQNHFIQKAVCMHADWRKVENRRSRIKKYVAKKLRRKCARNWNERIFTIHKLPFMMGTQDYRWCLLSASSVSNL